MNIVGKPGEEFPNVKKPCQGQIWISADYQSEFIFDNLKWHVVDPKPTCNKVLVDYIFKEHTIPEVLADFGANIFGVDGTITMDTEVWLFPHRNLLLLFQ